MAGFVKSFSGAHPFRPACLVARVLEGEGDVEDAAALVELIDEGRCPRCQGPLPVPPSFPAGSRVTVCRCIPVCGPCGTDEAWSSDTLWLLGPGFSVTPDEMAERYTRATKNATSSIAVIESDGEGSLAAVDEEGVSSIELPPPSSGWRLLGHDDEHDEEERRG